MKLSKTQSTVIKLMREGWEMGRSTSFNDNRIWLQKNGIGRGGETFEVRFNTYSALGNRELIKLKEQRFPTSLYELTEIGKMVTL